MHRDIHIAHEQRLLNRLREHAQRADLLNGPRAIHVAMRCNLD